jgi:hypothetical protein
MYAYQHEGDLTVDKECMYVCQKRPSKCQKRPTNAMCSFLAQAYQHAGNLTVDKECMCVCVCMYAYVRIYTYIRIYVYTRILLSVDKASILKSPL